jgi:outer membrane protein assembly factor BamB
MPVEIKTNTHIDNQTYISSVRRTCYLFVSFCIFATLSGFIASGQKVFEWPCFHGADRTNKSSETGLMKEWPKDGPKLKWTAAGLGEGYSSVSVGGGFLYASGKNSGQTYVFCFDLEGKPIWKKPNGDAWSTTLSYASSYTGARSTPTYNNGIIYHLGELGKLTAFNAKTGEEIWHRELARDFIAEIPTYGYSESVLIDGDHLYVRPFGKKGYQVCLNKNNGELIWANTEVAGKPGYSSMVIDEFGGYRQIVGSVGNYYYSLDTQTGKLLWKAEIANQRELNITDAILYKDYIFLSSGYGKGSILYKLNISSKSIVPETVWQSALMDNHHGGVILDNGFLYGAGSNSRGWYCLNFLTGKEIWKTEGKGSVTYADGMLYLLDERGTVKLVKATPDKYEPSGEFKVPKGGEGMYWAHPVVCGGTLYIRHADKLYAYDISGK